MSNRNVSVILALILAVWLASPAVDASSIRADSAFTASAPPSAPTSAPPDSSRAGRLAAAKMATDFDGGLDDLLAAHPGQSAAVTLERGELSLLSRAWLADHCARSLDVQYFIWTADNVGRLAMDGLLRAAERGVKVRVLVDDLLLDMPPGYLQALDGHPNLDIRIYNPNSNTGLGMWKKSWNAAMRFRDVNQRMHNKALIVDGKLAVTGGRNLADEYFDFHHDFDFRDRDVMVAGPVAAEMSSAFQRYWDSPLARPVGELLPSLAQGPQAAIRDSIHAYARDTANFRPEIREVMMALPGRFGAVVDELAWGEVRFVTDEPGKNDGRQGLQGGGATTHFLADLLRGAKRSVTIQSPYLIPNDTALALFKEAIARGVSVRISTNSMANNDNLKAVSGYLKRRKQILAAGVKVFEYKPQPGIQGKLQERYAIVKDKPIFVIHAKTLVVDGAEVFIGTFNLDPRSMNLNTESGVFLPDPRIAREVEAAIERDMSPENSWDASRETGDGYAPFWRRVKARMWGLLPMESIL
jgi:putative cardiolipin synthase